MVLQKTDYRRRNVKNLYISFLLQKKLFLTSTTKSKRLFKILSVMNAFVPLSMKAKAIAIISTTRSANCLIVCAWNCSLHLDPNLDDDDEWKTDRKGSSKKVFFSVTVPLLSQNQKFSNRYPQNGKRYDDRRPGFKRPTTNSDKPKDEMTTPSGKPKYQKQRPAAPVIRITFFLLSTSQLPPKRRSLLPSLPSSTLLLYLPLLLFIFRVFLMLGLPMAT